MFIVAIILLMSPAINGGQFKSMRLAEGASADPLIRVVGPGAPLWPVGGKSWDVGALPLADAWEDEAAEPASFGITKLDSLTFFSFSSSFCVLS